VLGGDITLVKGELGGAGFRVTLPAAQDSPPAHPVTFEPPVPKDRPYDSAHA
jgi:hypothetical protein